MDNSFMDKARSRFRLVEDFQRVDQRLRWLLDNYPEIYVQLIPRASRYGTDDGYWAKLTPEERNRVLRYMIARFAAWPQIFWLVTNDAPFGVKDRS